MFDEGGSLDPLLKFLLYGVLALAIGKMVWEWLTDDVSRWITVDLWGLIANHPWWTALIAVGALVTVILVVRLLLFLLGAGTYAYVGGEEDYSSAAGPGEAPDPCAGGGREASTFDRVRMEWDMIVLFLRIALRRPAVARQDGFLIALTVRVPAGHPHR